MGGVRFDLNIDLASYLIGQMNTNIIDYLAIQSNIDGETLLNTKKLKKVISDGDIQSTSRQIADFLKMGIKG
jgi:hypothetical protein